MTSTSDVEGVKISNINLTNPCLRVPYGNPKFHVKINVRGKSETSTKTEKKSLDGDRVIWNESFSFAGYIADSVVTFQVFKTRFLPPKLVGTLEKKVGELISLQSDSGSCTFDMGGKCGQLTFCIELQPARLPDVVAQASEIANVISSADNTFSDTWSPFLTQFQIFVEIVDKIVEIHPYATLAWNIFAVIPKTIMSLKSRDESIKQLCEKLKDTYDFFTDAERLPRLNETQTSVLSVLIQQTIECGYFIREYSKGNTVSKIWKGARIDDKIKAFIDKFDHIQKAMTDFTILETSIATLRVSETISEIKELTLLNEMPYARDAGFVSGKRCLPGTRQDLIQEIMEWVNNDTGQQILVLSGAAGTGKSAIAHTIAEIFRKQNRLGSLFCFSRSYKDRHRFLFSTISRGLADTDVSWRKGLMKVIEDTAIRTSTDLETQFEELIVKPSRETAVVGPVVIVIDALDESGDRAERVALLDILFGRLSALPNNFRILLTTRPEPDIEPRCQYSRFVCKRMGDIALNGTLSDIRRYVSFRLKNITATLDEIQNNWRDVLAERSEGLFQWAETVCRFIDPTVRNPVLVEKQWKTCTSGSSTSLYELYHGIISSQQEARDSDFINDFKKLISAIMTAREPLTIHALKALLQDIRSVQMTLEPFGSLLLGVHDSSTPIRPLHTSLFDFFHSPVQNEAKDNQYYVDASDQSVFTLGCLMLLNRTLQFNICNLETSHLRNRDIPDLDARVKKAIPLELSYSCRFWAFHLQYSRDKRNLVPELRTLTHEKILYLLEALSLLGAVNPALAAMRIVSSWCKDVDNELAEELLDAWQFGLDFGEMMTESTPHLYLSALPFTPRNSFISKQYLPMYPQLLSIEVGQSLCSPTRTGLVKRKSPPSRVGLLVFSPQDNLIATAFWDGTLWIWDYETGQIIHEWKDRYSKIHISDIVFSPDGQLIYWCFKNATIQIFNISTKEVVEESYQKVSDDDWESDGLWPWPWCTISSDNRYVAFSVGHEKLVLYDRQSCQELIQVMCYSYPRPAFSPNGNMFAFPVDAPNGRELCLWDTRRQAFGPSLKLPEERCPWFALNDKHVAFRTDLLDSQKIEIWDISTLAKVRTITMGCISPDFRFFRFISDKHLITGIRRDYSMWNVSTGECILETSFTGIWDSTAAFHESKPTFAVGDRDGAIHVRQWDTPVESKTLDDVMTVDPTFWLRGRYLIQRYYTPNYYLLLISDIRTVNNIVFEPRNIRYGVAVSPSDIDGHVYVAYCAALGDLCGLHLWSDVGDFILDEGEHIFSAQFSTAGDRLFSIHTENDSARVKIWDTCTRTLISEYPRQYCSNIFTPSLAFSASSDNFLVAYETSEGTSFIEVCDCQSGGILKGPFKISTRPPTIAYSANETRIICLSESNIDILDVQTGKEEVSVFQDWFCPQLSRNRKYAMWCLDVDSKKILIWDIDHGVQLQLSFNGYLRSFFFSDDSAQIMALYDGDDGEYRFDICDISTRRTTCSVIGVYTGPVTYRNHLVPLSDGNYFAFIPDDYHIITSLNLSVHKIMSLLYDHHRQNSQFGMLPTDHPETRQTIKALNGSTSANTEILEYALTAWNKALFSQAFQREGSNGWILGPHGELLFWVPENRRHALWRPCVTHIAAKDFTKLNFDNFVHGSRWTECRGIS